MEDPQLPPRAGPWELSRGAGAGGGTPSPHPAYQVPPPGAITPQSPTSLGGGCVSRPPWKGSRGEQHMQSAQPPNEPGPRLPEGPESGQDASLSDLCLQ